MDSLQIKSRIIVHIIAILGAVFLMGVVIWALFFKEEPMSLIGPGLIIAVIIGSIGSVIIYMAGKMILTRPPIITIDATGFEYNPGGVSTGHIPWSAVAAVKEVEVLTSGLSRSGPIPELTLGIKLKDPEAYKAQYNAMLRGLMDINQDMYDADIFFRLSDFGKQKEEVKKLMFRYGNKSKFRT